MSFERIRKFTNTDVLLIVLGLVCLRRLVQRMFDDCCRGGRAPPLTSLPTAGAAMGRGGERTLATPLQLDLLPHLTNPEI